MSEVPLYVGGGGDYHSGTLRIRARRDVGADLIGEEFQSKDFLVMKFTIHYDPYE